MIDSQKLLLALKPNLKNSPRLLQFSTFLLRRWVLETRFNQFFGQYQGIKNFEMIEQALHYLNITYQLANRDYENIPTTGKVVIIANHPLGCMDAFALIDCIARVRRDVKIVANQILLEMGYLNDLLLPVNNLSGKSDPDKINQISAHLQNEGCVIIFPAGEVSRIGSRGVRESKWRGGFLRLATQARAPIIPVHINAKNSWLFYTAASISNNLAMSLLPREIFGFANKNINLTIGEQIPYTVYQNIELPARAKIKLFNKHLYAIGKRKSGMFKTEKGIALPEDKAKIKQELLQAQLLLNIGDNKSIYLLPYRDDSAALREVGRLREISFRAVGEGSGKRRDIDHFDQHYLHILVWDHVDLEIAGAYRLLPTQNIHHQNCDKLYSSTLFKYHANFNPYFAQGLELGRSFVQPRYWGKKSLEYLWLGIGAFLQQNPQYRYLFGTVSISNNLPELAKQCLVYYYQHYFGQQDEKPLLRHRHGYILSHDQQQQMQDLFAANQVADDFKKLKDILKNLGASVPTLYKQYSELCEPGGVQFLQFGTDPNFNHCLDALVLVDIQKMRARKYKRYLQNS